MKVILFAILFFSYSNAFSQGWVPSGGKSMSMANSSVCFEDVWAYHNNPAALGSIETLSVGLSYENRFLLKELQSQGLALAIPLKVGVLSVGGHLYGYNQFRSIKSGLGYSMRLSDKLYAGVQFNYQGIRLASNYGSKNSMTAEAGLYAKITDNWSLGMAVFNLGRSELSEYQDDRFSTIMRIGSSYLFSKKLLLSFEFEKDLESFIRIKSGLEYQVVNSLYIRGGVATAPIEMTLGVGYEFKKVDLDIGSAYHQVLGWSPHFSINFHLDE